MVGIARFELATFCPPDKRAKPGCAISRLDSNNIHHHNKNASQFSKKMKTLSHKLHNFHKHPIKIQDLYRITEFFDGSLLNMQNNIISFIFQLK